MGKYSPLRVKQLVLLCCWQQKVEPNANGFQKLEERWANLKAVTTVEIKAKYLQNQWSELKNALEQEIELSFNDGHMDALALHAGFAGWNDFQRCVERIASFLEPYVGADGFDTAKVLVLTDQDTRTNPLSLVTVSSQYVNLEIQLKHVEEIHGQFIHERLNEYLFVLTYLPPKAVALDREELSALSETRRYVPVWKGDPHQYMGLNHWFPEELIVGESNLLLALLLLDEYKNKQRAAGQEKNRTSQRARFSKIRNNHGTIFLGDVHIKGTNITLGDSHQHFHHVWKVAEVAEKD